MHTWICACATTAACKVNNHNLRPYGIQEIGPCWEDEGEDGCFYTQVPYHIADLVDLSMPRGNVRLTAQAQLREGMLDSTRDKQVCWVGACGCRRITIKRHKGLDAEALLANSLRCTGTCSGARRANGLCYCHSLLCRVCAKMQRSLMPEEAQMMQVTRHVVHERRLRGHDWLHFVEVPITCRGNRMSVDVMLVLEGFPCPVHEPISSCVLAVEHQGTTHVRARPHRGDREAGQIMQEQYDEVKLSALQHLGVPLLCFHVEKSGCVVAQRCKAKWEQSLHTAMLQYERHLAAKLEAC